ncbi:MAG: hypothetical protein J7J15_03670 [Candidatus Aenigmarchaeota archaeon]|nr:hypothetical protein [Candidatus Aenigmarchaeota archaeon]
MSKKVKVEEIGVSKNLPNTIVLKGTKKSVFGEKTAYAFIIPRDVVYNQITSLIEGSQNKDNQMIKTIFELTEENVKKLDVVKYRKNFVDSSLDLCELKLNHVEYAAGLIYALIGQGKIYIDDKLFVTDKKLSNNQKLKNELEKIQYRNIDFIKPVDPLKEISINKENYTPSEFHDTIEVQMVGANPYIPILIPLGIENFLVYKTEKSDRGEYYAFVAPEDYGIKDKLKETEKKRKKSDLYDVLGTAKELLQSKGYKLEGVYADINPVQIINSFTTLVEARDTAIQIKRDDEVKTFNSSEYFGVGLGFLYSDNLYLNLKGDALLKQEETDDLSYIR